MICWIYAAILEEGYADAVHRGVAHTGLHKKPSVNKGNQKFFALSAARPDLGHRHHRDVHFLLPVSGALDPLQEPINFSGHGDRVLPFTTGITHEGWHVLYDDQAVSPPQIDHNTPAF